VAALGENIRPQIVAPHAVLVAIHEAAEPLYQRAVEAYRDGLHEEEVTE